MRPKSSQGSLPRGKSKVLPPPSRSRKAKERMDNADGKEQSQMLEEARQADPAFRKPLGNTCFKVILSILALPKKNSIRSKIVVTEHEVWIHMMALWLGGHGTAEDTEMMGHLRRCQKMPGRQDLLPAVFIVNQAAAFPCKPTDEG
ncbi:hypothetical protein U0070_023539 [Myodes glareolus]|uniref:Uncharacterized protein n=1 Tax=Myodes glareolus TaxID=447135 RepID=A0AAW0I1J0_MYOGA